MNSEQFTRAAHTLSHSLDNFNRNGSFEQSVAQFQRSVDKMVQAMGMHAENQCRINRGDYPTYDEEAFARL